MDWTPGSRLAVAALLIAFLATLMLSCACGHLGRGVLPVTAVAVVMVIAGMIRDRRPPLAPRLLIDAIFAATLLILAKNAMDVLWFGHDPMFNLRYEQQVRAGQALVNGGQAGVVVAALLGLFPAARQIRRR